MILTKMLVGGKRQDQCPEMGRLQWDHLGFTIINLLADGQFEPLLGNLAYLWIALDSVSRDEHVPEIKRYIRTAKERT
jgi:hypothetical protein